jgi:hypothetical protein
MAAADTTFQTSITINGKMDAALLRDLMKFNSELGKTVTQEKKVGAEAKKTTDGMKKGLMEVANKSKELAVALKDMMLPLLGISIAFKGLSTIGDTLQTAIDKFKGAREAAAAFKATIADVVGVSKTKAWDAFFKSQSEHTLSRFTGKEGPIYGRGMTRSIQEAFMKQRIQASNALIQAVIEKQVHATGSLEINPEAAAEQAAKWATMINLPKGRIPPELISELQLQSVKDLQTMSRAQKEALLVREFGGMTDVEAMIREQPLIAEKMGLGVKTGAALKEAGEPLADIQTQGEIVSEELGLAFIPVLKTIATAINDYLKAPMEVVKGLVHDLDLEMKKVFSPDDPTWAKLNLGERIIKAWNTDVIPALKAGWDGFVTWAGDSWKRIGNEFNLWRDEIKKRGARRIDIGYGVTVDEQPGAKNMSQFVETMVTISENLGKAAINLGQITASMVKVSWETMQKAVVDLANAATRIANTLASYLPQGNPEEAAKLRKELEDSGALPKSNATPNLKPFKTSGFATGGVINVPQVGLIGEAGPESIVPHKRNTNTLDILASTFSALGIDPANPNAYGHELFDATRMGPTGAGGGAGFTGNVGGIFYTEYGPRIDPPGSPDWDINSYNRRGAWSYLNPLREGDVALGYGAQARYGVQPGDVFTDTRGQTVRFADRSGSKNPMNEDVFHLAAGGIVSKKILSWLGESGPEAVVPLSGSKGRDALSGMGSSGHTFNFSPSISVSGVATSEVVAELSETLQRNFSKWIEDAAFEHERRAYT